jgi:toxin-antitoxin system PIN domain toxin
LTSLPDVNVLLALAWAHHPHHQAAHAWFVREANAGWATCLLTQSGLLRLSLNPVVVGVAIDCQAAHQLLTKLIGHPTHRFIDVAPTLAAAPFDGLVPRISGYRQVSDAILLHIAKVHGLKLVTFDQASAALCPWPGTLELLSP